MKPTSLVLRVVLPLLCVTHVLHAQNFTSPEVWTSEDFTNQRIGVHLSEPGQDFAWNAPLAPHTAIGNNYKDMLYALPGNFNGAVNTYKGVSTSVQSVDFLFGIDDPDTPMDSSDKYLAIYSLESRGYHLNDTNRLDTTQNYFDPDVINKLEGLSLYNQNVHQAYTYHPTIWRFDKSVMAIRTNTIRAAVSGDFTGDGQDEIALLIKDGTDQKIIIIRCYNYFGEALNYTTYAYSPMSIPVATMDFDSIKFACSGHYTEQHSKIAVLYANPNGQQEIYTFEPGSSSWTLDRHYSQPKSTFDIANVRFVASGLFEHGSPTPRMAICYDDVATNTEKVFITHDYGVIWALDERFSKPRSQFDFNKVRHVVAGAFDDVAGDDELAMFYDHGNDATGLGSVQQVLVTTHDTPWNTTVAINEKRSAMDFDLIRHAYAANLDYNSGARRDEIGIVYNDKLGNDDGQTLNAEKVYVYTNKPSFAENDFMIDANVQPYDMYGQPVGDADVRPFFPLGWFGIPYDELDKMAARSHGAYNTVWLGAVVPRPPAPYDEVTWQRQYQDQALRFGLHTVREIRPEMYSNEMVHDLIHHSNPNSPIAWCTVDEPDGRKVTKADVAKFNNVARNTPPPTPADMPLMPIMSGDFGADRYRDECDLVCQDGYAYFSGGPFSVAPVLAAMRSSLFPRRNMQTTIRYNKPTFIYIPQGIPVSDDGHATPDRLPTLEELRYNDFAPLIEGARGLIYYTYTDDHTKDNTVVSRRIDLIAQELAHYIPALSTQSLSGRVTIDKHGFVPAEFHMTEDPVWTPNPIRIDFSGGTSRYMSLFSYTLHQDPSTNRYYLFVANNWSLPVENVELTAFGVPGEVNFLPAEYFQNGHSVPMNARTDAAGGYVTFHDSFRGNEVKVYAIGDLPSVETPDGGAVRQMQGDLSFSNQRKLAAAPRTTLAFGAPLYNSDIYYHLVYHRLDQLTGRNKVYYRRSKSSKRDMPMETVEWEPWEMCLSDDMVKADETPITGVDCVHPSIVVRYDLAHQVNRAYVVFNCSGEPEASGGYVVESIIAADATYTPPVVAPRAHSIASYVGRNLDEWGTPMIDATSSGNYYVWADSLSGIKAGWKIPGDISLTHTADIHWNASGFKAQHPSLNSYSHISDQEDNCALVWQESGEGALADIYYTRLRGDAGGIGIYLPSAAPRRTPLTINPGNTIVRVSNGNYGVASDNRMPVVNRGEELGQTDGPPMVGAQLMDLDGIYWETRMVPDNNPTVIPEWMRYGTIGYRPLDFYDRWSGTRWEPNYWYGAPARWIWSSRKNLSQPSVAPGAPTDINRPYAGDHAVILNFIATDPLNLSTSLWHLAHGYTTLNRSDDDNGFRTSPVNADELGGPVQNPQLASQPFIGGPKHWFRSQRVFNSGTAPGIVASRSFLTKSAVSDLKPCPLFGFGNSSGFSLVTPFLLNGDAIPLALPQWDSSVVNPPDPGDTVRTGWFTVGSRQQLEFALLGKTVTSGMIGGGSPRTELWIERKLTGARMQIALPAGDDIKGVPVTCSLVNGADEEYCLLVINRDVTSHYTEQLVLDGLPVSDTVHADTSALHKGPAGSGLDLGLLRGDAVAGGATLAVYPNPATDKVIVTLGGGNGVLRAGEKATLTITSALGTVVDRREIEFMRGMELDVAGLASGVYFVNVGTGDGPLATASFIVQR